MSDDWRVPADLADRVRDANYKDAWEREIEHTAQVRGILRDLIADLRDDAQSARALGGDLMDRTRVLSRLDRAEARLREIGGDDADM